MPLFRRFGRPGLLGAVTRTAVVAGTATMIARAVNMGLDDRSRARSESNHVGDAQSAGTTPGEQVPAESITSQLATLSALKASGAISADEFARAKTQVLGG